MIITDLTHLDTKFKRLCVCVGVLKMQALELHGLLESVFLFYPDKIVFCI